MILGLPEFWCRMSSNNSCLVSGDVARDLIATADRTVLQSWLYDAVWTSYKSVVKHPVENILLIMSWSLRMLEPSHPFRKQWPHWFSATHILWWAGPLDPRWNIFVDVCGNSPAACRCCSNVWWDSSPFRGPNIQDVALNWFWSLFWLIFGITSAQAYGTRLVVSDTNDYPVNYSNYRSWGFDWLHQVASGWSIHFRLIAVISSLRTSTAVLIGPGEIQVLRGSAMVVLETQRIPSGKLT